MLWEKALLRGALRMSESMFTGLGLIGFRGSGQGLRVKGFTA